MNRYLSKYLTTPLRQQLLTLWIDGDLVERWLTEWRFFFVLSSGRSGTAFLADLLGKADGAHVFHEPVLLDRGAHARAHYDAQAAAAYIRGFRKKEIFVRMRHEPPGIYGEVNSTLRCHAEALSDVFPGVVLLHLVRDGRDVVRSTMGRGSLTLRNPFSLAVHPTDSDPWRARWRDMDRFSRICWYWQLENSRLRKRIGKMVQLERILSDYRYFRKNVLQPCNLVVPEQVWQAAVASPVNTSARFVMPKWGEWTSVQQQTFREICGEEMAACGYVL